MYNIVVLTMNSFLHLVDQDTLLIVCTVVLFVMYTWYVCTVITHFTWDHHKSLIDLFVLSILFWSHGE